MEQNIAKILIIDDNEDNLISLKALISDFFYGITVYTANSGSVGIRLARKYSPDVILLDILMPIMDGFEVCKILKEDVMLCDIPVVFVTALKENNINKVYALEVGAEGFLTKPVDENELCAQIKAMLKIKAASDFQKKEKQRLEEMVVERTKELQKSKDDWENIFQAIGHPTIILNTSHKIIAANEAALKASGQSIDEILGSSCFSIFHCSTQTCPPLGCPLVVLLNQGSTEIGEMEMEAFNGTYLVSCKPVFNEKGEIEHIIHIATDITERKLAEKAVKESEEKFRSLIESSNDGICLQDMSGNIVFANKRKLELLGYENEEQLIGNNVFSLLNESEQKRLVEVIPILMEKGFITNVETEVIKNDGTLLSVDLNFRLIRDEKGDALYIMDTMRDITERKMSEKLLRQRLDYESLLNDILTMVIGTNDVEEFYDHCLAMVGERVDVDRTYFFKYNEITDTVDNTHEWCAEGITQQKDELQGIPVSMFSWWHQIMLQNEFVCYSNIEDIPDEATKEILRPQGIKSILIVPLFINGKYYGFFGLDDCVQSRDWLQKDVDIILSLFKVMGMAIERMQAEKILVDERQQLLSIFNGIEEPVYIADPFTHELLFVNRFLENLLGSDLLGEKCYKRLYGFDAPCEFCTNHIILQNSGEVYKWEYHNKKLNRHYLIIDRIIKWTDKRDVRFEMAIDITERKKMMEELIAAKSKAEESDRLKSAFLANMSHEIRTPMNGILGFTNLLLEPDLSSQEKDKFIKIVHKSGQRMLNTVNDIVEISKIEAGLVNRIENEIDLNKKLEELTQFFKLEAENKGLELILEKLLPANSKKLVTDQNKFDSILSNLIKNAIKYTDKGTIKIGCNHNDKEIEFYIKDTGIGIPENRQKAVFNRFEQADIADIRVFEGSGLGLAIAKSYVEMLGGKIWVESEEGKGSAFYFTLPTLTNLTEKSNSEKEISTHNKKQSSKVNGLKILIAEDDEVSRDYISIIVEDFGSEILVAKSGIETIDVCLKNKDLDLILMDIKMPGMNGYEAAHKIREFNKEVVILAQTAYGLSGDRKNAIEAGCNDYIAKPINKIELELMIQKYFGK